MEVPERLRKLMETLASPQLESVMDDCEALIMGMSFVLLSYNCKAWEKS